MWSDSSEAARSTCARVYVCIVQNSSPILHSRFSIKPTTDYENNAEDNSWNWLITRTRQYLLI